MTVVTRLQIENYRRIKAVEIRPGEGANIVPIIGKNAQGKSSILDAIMAALGGKSYLPDHPVHRGEDEAAIRVELSNGLVIRRIIDKDGSGSILVENQDGMRPGSPQAMLDKLYTSVAFDPLAFTRLKPAEQLEQLRRLVKIEVDLDELATRRKVQFDQRTEWNREVKTWEGQLAGFADVGEPKEPIDTGELGARINSASASNTEIEQRRVRREAAERSINDMMERETEMVAEIGRKQRQLEEMQMERFTKEKQLADAEPLPELVDVSELTQQLREAEVHNRQVQRAKEKKALQARVDALKAKAEEATKFLENIDKAKEDAFAKAEMPVEGLKFGDGEVLFNDFPLNEASSAEQLRASVAIGVAQSPDLKVMLVRDASLLDEDGLAQLAQMAVESGHQFWIESVDRAGAVGIIIEDGAVKDAETPPPIDKGKRRPKKTPEAAQGAQPEPKDMIEVQETGLMPETLKTAEIEPETETAVAEPTLDDGGQGEEKVSLSSSSPDPDGGMVPLEEERAEPGPRANPTSLFDD